MTRTRPQRPRHVLRIRPCLTIGLRLTEGFDLFQVETALRAKAPQAWVARSVEIDCLHHEVEVGVKRIHRAPEIVGMACIGYCP